MTAEASIPDPPHSAPTSNSKPKPNPHHALGRWGEDRAARFFESRGLTVLARNYRFGRREVDLVVRCGDTVAFVEVKTRAGGGFGSPEESITRLKRREVEAVAAHFLHRHDLQEAFVRFDAFVIVVERGESGGVVVREEYMPDAWRPEA